jgi:hypothetical protein
MTTDSSMTAKTACELSKINCKKLQAARALRIEFDTRKLIEKTASSIETSVQNGHSYYDAKLSWKYDSREYDLQLVREHFETLGYKFNLKTDGFQVVWNRTGRLE